VFVVSVGLFIVFLDSTIVNIALPTIIADYGIDLGLAAWIINAFVLTLAVTLITLGKLADWMGKAKTYMLGLVVFLVSSFLCGIAPSAESLIAFRVLQGLGGAMVIPTSMMLVREAVPPEKTGLAMGVWGAVGALAVAVGPSLGGVITESIDWRWIFYINVPVILVALPPTWWVFRRYLEVRRPLRLDVGGMLALSVALFCLTYAILEGERLSWTSAAVLGTFGLSALSGLLFLWIERKAKHPLFDFALFRNRHYVAGMASNLLGGILLMGTMILLPVYLVQVKEYDTLNASLAITPLSAVMLVVAPLAGRLIDRIGYVVPMAAGYLISFAGFSLLSTLTPDMSVPALLGVIAMTGVGLGLIMITSVTVCTVALTDDQLALGTGIFATVRNLGGALGVSLFVSITLSALNHYAPLVINDGIHRVQVADMPPAVREAAIARLEARREDFFDPNRPVEGFTVDPTVREALVEQKVREALAQLPPGTPRNDPVLRRVRQTVAAAVDRELARVVDELRVIQETLRDEGKTYAARAIGISFLCGVALLILFSPSVPFLRKRKVAARRPPAVVDQ